jgi:hypothetical protein
VGELELLMRGLAGLAGLAGLLGAALLGACYQPAFEPCAVRCAGGAPCPDGMTCGADLNCHASEDEPACPPSELTVNVNLTGTGSTGGVVTDDTGKLDCGRECTLTVLEGSIVTLKAFADDTARFDAWFGVDGCDASGLCRILVNDNIYIDAEFIRQFQVSILFLGNGTGRVRSSPPGIDCTELDNECIASFDEGTTVAVTAEPDNVFDGWFLGPETCGAEPRCEFKLDASIELGPYFD